MTIHHHRALVPRGLEPIAAKEIRALGGGIGKTRGVRGSVLFQGPADAHLRANLHLRTVDRVLLVVGRCEGRFENELDAGLRAVPWERWIPAGAKVHVAVSARGCRLFHTGLVEELARKALVARGIGDGRPGHESGEPQGRDAVEEPTGEATIDLRGTDDQWELAIDTSGRGLHRRGYRKATAKAPLKETIAAGILMAAGYSGGPLLDPMCGAGTIVIEAAWMAAGRAPGLERTFAFEQFPSLDRERWGALLLAAKAAVDPSKLPPLEGSDRAGGALRAARANADRAGLKGRVRWVQRPLSELPRVAADAPPSLVLFNPPFGKRATADAPSGTAAERETWRIWGETIRAHRPGSPAWLLAPSPELAVAAGAKGRARFKVGHGGITVGLHRIA